MSNMKKIIISIFALIMCIVVTYAWINELQNPHGRVMALRLNDASIASSDLIVTLSSNVKDDIFTEITKLCEEYPEQTLEVYDNFAPGTRQKFRADITNLSKSSVNLRLFLSEIVCEDTELQENIIIGTNGFSGFTEAYPAPSVQNKRLADGMDAAASFILIENVEIPPYNVDEPVSIYFYVMFSAAGTENLEDTSFSIGKINFLTI